MNVRGVGIPCLEFDFFAFVGFRSSQECSTYEMELVYVGSDSYRVAECSMVVEPWLHIVL